MSVILFNPYDKSNIENHTKGLVSEATWPPNFESYNSRASTEYVLNILNVNGYSVVGVWEQYIILEKKDGG